jgi:hypothetical protein
MDIATKTPKRIAGYSVADAGGFQLLQIAVERAQSGSLYFSDGSFMYAVPKDGSAPPIRRRPSGRSGPIYIDDVESYVYWVEGIDLVREHTTGGGCGGVAVCPQTISHDFSAISGIATDGSYIYVADNGNAQLVRMPKQPPFDARVLVQRGSIAQIAVDSVAIYYVVQFDNGKDGYGSVWMLAK